MRYGFLILGCFFVLSTADACCIATVRFKADSLVMNPQVKLADIAEVTSTNGVLRDKLAQALVGYFPGRSEPYVFNRSLAIKMLERQLPFVRGDIEYLGATVLGINTDTQLVAGSGVKQGESVLIQLRHGLVSIEDRAIALQTARVGQLVALRRSNSGERIQGVVRDQGLVEIK